MKAPDGSPTSLTEEHWLLIRTPEFRNMFGDWETVAELTAHVMNSREEGLLQAKKALELIKGQNIQNLETGFFAVVNSTQANELVSLRTRDRSTRNGFTAEEHFAAVANIKNLWKHAYALGSHGDLKFKDNRGVERVTDPSLTILRFVAPVQFPSGAGLAYLTLKQRPNEGNKLYSLELTDIKKLNAYSSALSETAGIARSLSFENILNSFEEKIKTLSPRLDAHGEPRAEAVEQILSEYFGTLHQGESSSPRASFSPVTEAEAVLLRDADAWKKAVDAFLADKLSRKSLIPVLSQTPLVFQLVGAKNLPMVTRQKVLTKVLKEKHHLDPELVKQIPKALAEPVMIVRSTGVDANSDITVVLDLRDRHRATVVVPVMFSDTGHGYEMNFLPSIYVKNDEKTKMPNNQWFVEQMISGNVLYADKKKVTEWNRVAKRQLPGWNSIPNAKTLFTKDDLVKLRVRYSGRYQGESSSPRASFSPVTEAKGIIRFFQSADISSAGHEIGHSLRRVLELGANMDNSPDFVRRDWESACAFVGAEPGAAWTVVQEEKFADSFVDYQQKGPPSAGLRRAFTRPARRLTERQRRIRGLDVQVSPEMSRVFERLPVTERELAAAKQREESEYMR